MKHKRGFKSVLLNIISIKKKKLGWSGAYKTISSYMDKEAGEKKRRDCLSKNEGRVLGVGLPFRALLW